MEIGRQFSFEILIPCPERRNVRARIEGLMMVSGAEKSRVALTAASNIVSMVMQPRRAAGRLFSISPRQLNAG
jgi:hypothetical protein